MRGVYIISDGHSSYSYCSISGKNNPRERSERGNTKERKTHWIEMALQVLESSWVSTMKCKLKWCMAEVYQVWAGTTFFGVAGFLVCHRWLWMVTASTLADMVLAGIWLNCFLSELYL